MNTNTQQLPQKTAIITGGTRGFGLAVARALLESGCQVVVASRRQAGVDEALQQLNAGERAAGMACDVAQLEQVQALADMADRTFGGFEIWINNAGTAGPYGPTASLAPENFARVVQTNILGTYHGSQVALQHLLPRQQGCLVNILGHGSDGPVPFQNAYASSKYWVKTFTLCLAKEYSTSGVSIFAFHPGMMMTELLTEVEVIEGHEHQLKVFPTILRMLAKPPEIPARKLARLCSGGMEGKSGKIYRSGSVLSQLGCSLREGLRQLRGERAPEDLVHIRSVKG